VTGPGGYWLSDTSTLMLLRSRPLQFVLTVRVPLLQPAPQGARWWDGYGLVLNPLWFKAMADVNHSSWDSYGLESAACCWSHPARPGE
jgi:hypothetical protein